MGLSKIFPCLSKENPGKRPNKKPSGGNNNGTGNTNNATNNATNNSNPPQLPQIDQITNDSGKQHDEKQPKDEVESPEQISERIWDSAFDQVADDPGTKDLAEAYAKLIPEALKSEGDANTETGNEEAAAKMRDRSQRQELMRASVSAGIKKLTSSKTTKLSDAVGTVSNVILGMKDTIDLAISTNPQAALPWAGVCIGLQFFTNPASSQDANMEGIQYVTTRMNWYCGLSGLLLSKRYIKEEKEESFARVVDQLEETMTELYKSLLIFQMKSVCYYYRKQGWRFLKSLLNLDGWQGMLSSIKTMEESLQRDSEFYNTVNSRIDSNKLVKASQEMNQNLGDMHNTLKGLLEKQLSKDMNDQFDKCLEQLFRVDPRSQMDTIERAKEKLHHGSFEWLLHTEEYQSIIDWSPRSPRVLILNGPSGTGKTMSIIGIISELHAKSQEAPETVHFFFRADDKENNSAIHALRSLMWLLLKQQPHLASHLIPEQRSTGAALFESPSFFTLGKIFQNMLADEHLTPVYLVLDALDECAEGNPGVEELISDIISASLDEKTAGKVKWILTSQPEFLVHGRLRKMHPEAVLELDVQSNPEAVNAYIGHKLSELQTMHNYRDTYIKPLEFAIRERAQNLFLWVSLVFKDLAKVEDWRALAQVEKTPKDLTGTYEKLMAHIDTFDGQMQELCNTVLRTICFALRPLSYKELHLLAGLPSAAPPQDIVKKCGSFLATVDKTVSVLHSSVRKHLLGYFEARYGHDGIGEIHIKMWTRSITALSGTLRQDMYSLEPGSHTNTIVIQEDHDLARVRYSCEFWAYHLCEVDGQSPIFENQLSETGDTFLFLQKHLLHWLEGLSLIHKLPGGMSSMRKLIRKVHATFGINSGVTGFLDDVERFILSNWSIIEQAPMQAYGSALVFSPMASKVKTLYWEERLPFIRDVMGVEDDRDACLQILEGHTQVTKITTFSPDGKTLASGSSDTTVRLWDTATGVCKQKLEGHSEDVVTIVFSPDGKILASGGDVTVRLWDAVTGKSLKCLEGHNDRIRVLKFLHNGQLLASEADDGVTRLWDPDTGVCTQILKPSPFCNIPSAFSPDSKTIAWCSSDTTDNICLWDTMSCRQTLEAYEDECFSAETVTFSPDGNSIASGSDDVLRIWDATTGASKRTLQSDLSPGPVAFSLNNSIFASGTYETIQLWDASTGEPLQTLDGYGDSAIALSSDGKLVASALGDATMQLWDTRNPDCKRILEGHTDGIRKIAFSRDGRLLASCSYDTTVRLWNTATRDLLQPLEGHDGSVEVISLSLDGRFVASGSVDTTVRLWDIRRQVCKVLEGHKDSITTLAFSHKGRFLASGSYDGTVRLWETATGACKHLYEVSEYPIGSIVFKPDGKDGKLLAWSHDNAIMQLWDSVSGACKQSLQGHSGAITSLAFSSDSKTIASASDDKTVRVWDSVSGACKQTLEFSDDFSIETIAFQPGGNILASVSNNPSLRVWDITSEACVPTLEDQNCGITTMAFSPDGKLLALGFESGTVRLWDSTTRSFIRVLEHGDRDILSSDIIRIVFSPDGKLLASVSANTSVRLWNIATGACTQVIDDHDADASTIVFSPDSRLIASIKGGSDNTVRLWDATFEASQQQTSETKRFPVISVALSPDGNTYTSISFQDRLRWDAVPGAGKKALLDPLSFPTDELVFSPDCKLFAFVSNMATVELWDAVTGAFHKTLEGHSFHIRNTAFSHSDTKIISFSPDSKIIATGSSDKTIRLWDTASGAHLHTLEGHSNDVSVIVFSPDSSIVVSSSTAGFVRLWNTAAGEYVQSLEGNNINARTIAFSSDMKKVTAGLECVENWDISTGTCEVTSAVKVWDVLTGACELTLEGHNGRVMAVAFSPDGNTITSGAYDDTVRIWDLTEKEEKMNEGVPKRCKQILTFKYPSEKPRWSFQNTKYAKYLRDYVRCLSQNPNLPDMCLDPAAEDLFADDEWVTRDGKKLIWLPPDYRGCWDSLDDTVVIGNSAGRVITLLLDAYL